MTAPALSLPPEVQKLVDEKKFPALETVWNQKMEAETEPLEFFFALAAAVKKKGGGPSALGWLRFLADYHEGDERVRVLLELARMVPTDAAGRQGAAAALRQRI